MSAALASPGIALAQSAPTASEPIRVLSANDAQTYSDAFGAVRQGRFDVVDTIRRRVGDTCLIGRLAFARLMHPDYHATYDELKAWLAKYADQPDADRVYALARKRKPGTALEPLTPGGDLPTGMALQAAPDRHLKAPKSLADPKQQAAREAYYGGDVEGAWDLAERSGERWIAGLSAYRQHRYGVARDRFAALAEDGTQSEWVRAAADFWAARSATIDGHADDAQGYLRAAARYPRTFYGMIAGRALDIAGAAAAQPIDDDPSSFGGGVRLVYESDGVSPISLSRWARDDARARRVVAYAQVGLRTEAAGELRTALIGAGSSAQRKRWIALAGTLGLPVTSPRDREMHVAFDPSQYPAPDLQPTGGFTLQKALVYAIIKQESRFNAGANSGYGAYGLMQVTPATAASTAGVSPSTIDASVLLDPATNLRLGQDYVERLLSATGGDMLRAVAAYNAGPRGILKTTAALPDADSLLQVESTPGAQTREYVQRVMANYWTYRQMFGQASPSLDALASGSKTVLAAWDRAIPDPQISAPQGADDPSAPAVLVPTDVATNGGR